MTIGNRPTGCPTLYHTRFVENAKTGQGEVKLICALGIDSCPWPLRAPSSAASSPSKTESTALTRTTLMACSSHCGTRQMLSDFSASWISGADIASSFGVRHQTFCPNPCRCLTKPTSIFIPTVPLLLAPVEAHPSTLSTFPQKSRPNAVAADRDIDLLG